MHKIFHVEFRTWSCGIGLHILHLLMKNHVLYRQRQKTLMSRRSSMIAAVLSSQRAKAANTFFVALEPVRNIFEAL